MRLLVACSVTATTLVLGVQLAIAQSATPKEGQSADRQQRDRRECNVWAREQSRFDPAQPKPTKSAPAQRRGGVLKGAVIGGAAGGLIDDKGGEGAVVGGLVGGIRQGAKNQQARDDSEAAYAREMAWYEEGQAAYARAWSTCMQGRGYDA